jgi:hypothetical protein
MHVTIELRTIRRGLLFIAQRGTPKRRVWSMPFTQARQREPKCLQRALFQTAVPFRTDEEAY